MRERGDKDKGSGDEDAGRDGRREGVDEDGEERGGRG